MEKIENYPHYRFMAFVGNEDVDGEEPATPPEELRDFDGADYQRVVFDEDGLVHSKHMKYRRNR